MEGGVSAPHALSWSEQVFEEVSESVHGGRPEFKS